MSDKRLMDRKDLMDELGLGRRGAEALMRKLPTVTLEDLRKRYVWREDVERYLTKRTQAT